MACRKISFGHDIHCCSSFLLFLCPTSISILWKTCVYIHIPDYTETVYELPLLPNNTAVKHFYTNQEQCKCWLDIYYWGAGLVVTGQIHDIGQKVLQSSFQTGSSSSPSYFQILLLTAFLKEVFIRNIIIVLQINYTIIICITNNNNNYGRLQDLILHFKIPIARQKKLGNL